jgi:hypothetical protein
MIPFGKTKELIPNGIGLPLSVSLTSPRGGIVGGDVVMGG